MISCDTTKDSSEDFRFFNQNIVGHCAGCGVHIEHAVGVVPCLHGGCCRRCHQLALTGGTWSLVDGELRCADNALDCCTWVAHRSLSRTRTKPLLCECRHTHQCNEHGEAMVYRGPNSVWPLELAAAGLLAVRLGSMGQVKSYSNGFGFLASKAVVSGRMCWLSPRPRSLMACTMPSEKRYAP